MALPPRWRDRAVGDDPDSTGRRGRLLRLGPDQIPLPQPGRRPIRQARHPRPRVPGELRGRRGGRGWPPPRGGTGHHCCEHLWNLQLPWESGVWWDSGAGSPGGIALRARPQPPQVLPPEPQGGWGQAGFAGAAPRSALETKMFTAVDWPPAWRRSRWSSTCSWQSARASSHCSSAPGPSRWPRPPRSGSGRSPTSPGSTSPCSWAAFSCSSQGPGPGRSMPGGPLRCGNQAVRTVITAMEISTRLSPAHQGASRAQTRSDAQDQRSCHRVSSGLHGRGQLLRDGAHASPAAEIGR